MDCYFLAIPYQSHKKCGTWCTSWCYSSEKLGRIWRTSHAWFWCEYLALHLWVGSLMTPWARSIRPKFRPVRPKKEDHLKRWTRFFETFPVGPNRSIEFWTEISGKFGWMDRAPWLFYALTQEIALLGLTISLPLACMAGAKMGMGRMGRERKP